MRRKHLGIAIGCRHCNKRYYKPGGWADHMKNKHPSLSRSQWFADPKSGDPSSVVVEPDPHAAAAQVAKALAEKIYPKAEASKRPSAEKDGALAEKTYPKAEVPKRPLEEEEDGALAEKTYPRAEAPKRPLEEEEEGGATTDSDVIIVEAKTTAPKPKKRKE